MSQLNGVATPETAVSYYNKMAANLTQADRQRALSNDSRAISKKIYGQVSQFLASNKLIRANDLDKFSQPEAVIGCESFNTDLNVTNIGGSEILKLVQNCDVPVAYQDEACRLVATMIAKLKVANGDDKKYMSMHFNRGNQKDLNPDHLKQTISAVFAPAVHNYVGNIGMPNMESFGVASDRVLPDIRASFAVALLQFHRGLQDRIIPRRTSASPYVKYVVPYAEVYDMLESNNVDPQIRNEGDHIVPFIDLYANPRQVSNILQPIVPLVSNDDKGMLMADGVIRFNVKANLFTLALVPNKLGFGHVNYTDLVSENVKADSIYLKLSSGGVDEIIQVSVHHLNSARLNMAPNTPDSGIRQTILSHTLKLGKNTKTITGEDSQILKDCTATDCLRVHLHAAFSFSIKFGWTEGIGAVQVEAYNSNKAQVAEAVAQLAEGLSISLEGYSLDARYSEENLRKSNLAIRYNVRTFDFEISNGRNILIDYSFEEELPEFLMSLVTEATSLGADHRCIDIIIQELMYVYDVTNAENADPAFRERLDKIGFQYISSQLVRPCVYLATLDLNNVDFIRSGDYMGDVRAYVEWQLLNLTSLIYQNSFFKHQLRPGESPRFKLVTSSVVLENLFSIEHYHNHLNKESTAPANGTVEYQRILPNGTILDCVTCTFDYMRDKIFMIPFIEGDPESVLNFATNWDFGTFVAHYNPQLDNAVNKRIYSNTRQLPIPQCPIGLYLDVRNISKIIDMFQLVGNTSGVEALPQPSELLLQQFEEAQAALTA